MNHAVSTEDTGMQFCFCKNDKDYDVMIACDNEQCKIGWYHILCVNIDVDNIPRWRLVLSRML